MTELHPSATPARWQILVALGAVYIVWGTTYLAIRFADETMPPLLMAGSRFLIAGAILYVWLRARGVARPTRVNWRAALIVGALLLMAGNGGVVWSEVYLPSSVVALLVGTVPLWMTILDWLRRGGARPGPAVIIGLLCGFAGVALLVAPTRMVGTSNLNPAVALVVLGAAVCWAAGSLYSRSGQLPASPLMGTAVEMLAGGALLILLGSVLGEWSHVHVHVISTRSLLGFAYLIVFGSLVGFTAYIWILRHTSTAVASTYAYVNPVVAVFAGWAFAGEAVTSRTLLAAAVIVVGVVIITTFRGRARPQGRQVVQPDTARGAMIQTPTR